MKRWERYLFFQMSLNFAFFFLSIFLLYALIDLSIQGVRFFSRETIFAMDLLLYYLRHFATHLELFFPLTFLFSLWNVLSQLTYRLEQVALQMAGISLKRMLLPFFWFATLLTIISYVNSEWFAPNAIFAAQEFKRSYSKRKAKKETLHSLVLDDGSELVYQKFDYKTKELFDVFWLRSDEDLWHMKTLQVTSWPPIGFFVDHLVRGEIFEKKESAEKKTFEELPVKRDIVASLFIPFESRSLSTLFFQSFQKGSDRASIWTHLHYKLALPLLPFLILFSVAPFAMKFSRHRSVFLPITISLFAFIGIKTLFEGLLILGENQVIAASLSMWGPMALFFFLSIRSFFSYV